MTIATEDMDRLAACFEYPAAGVATQARAASQALSRHLAVRQALSAFADWVEADPAGAEERYTRLFDLDPACTLHVGYHLFGEDYARGTLLYQLRVELRAAGVDEGGDLPDFLPCLLRLVPRLPDPEDRRLLVDALLLPALDRMGSELSRTGEPYAELLRALPPLLHEAAGDPRASAREEAATSAAPEGGLRAHA